MSLRPPTGPQRVGPMASRLWTNDRIADEACVELEAGFGDRLVTDVCRCGHLLLAHRADGVCSVCTIVEEMRR